MTSINGECSVNIAGNKFNPEFHPEKNTNLRQKS